MKYLDKCLLVIIHDIINSLLQLKRFPRRNDTEVKFDYLEISQPH